VLENIRNDLGNSQTLSFQEIPHYRFWSTKIYDHKGHNISYLLEIIVINTPFSRERQMELI